MTVVSDNGKPVTEEKPESVSYDSHQRLLAQRKKDKERADAAEAERDSLKQKIEEAEAAKLKETSQFKTLYETETAKREAAERELSEMTARQIDKAKTDALSKELGSVSKSEYLKFAALAEIEMNSDGTPTADSVKKVANDFRKKYPELLTGKVDSSLPNEAARGNGKPPKAAKEDLMKLTPQQLKERLAQVPKTVVKAKR